MIVDVEVEGGFSVFDIERMVLRVVEPLLSLLFCEEATWGCAGDMMCGPPSPWLATLLNVSRGRDKACTHILS